MRPGRRGRIRLFVAALALALALAATGPAAAADHCYVMVFGSQSHPKRLKYTHTWATFVRAVGEGPDADAYRLHAHTISWLPRTLDIKVWDPHPEPGVNLDLESTLRAVYADGQRVTMWGPFVIPSHVYNRSVWVKQVLESGAAEYRAISTEYNLMVADCIHAVAAVDPDFGRDHYPLIRVGKPASRFIAREVMNRSLENSGINQKAYDNSWLIPRLGLARYPIEFVSPQQIPFKDCFFCRFRP